MNIIVSVKRVLDPKMPTEKFKIDAQNKQVLPPEGIAPVINPYDEHAVELALKLKDKLGGKVITITLGSQADSVVIKHTLSMGADDGYVISDAVFAGADSLGTAHILSKAIQKIGSYDLILFGRQAADWDEGLVGSLVAESLGLPLITLCSGIEVAGKELKVKRVTLDGYQIFAVPMPALVTVSSEVGKPRLPSGFRIVQASRKQIPVWNAQNIGVDSSQIKATIGKRKLVKLFITDSTRKVEFITGETPDEAAIKLAEKLKQTGVI